MPNKTPELSIIMPCLNEELTIGTCITKAQNWSKKNNVSTEIIIGDNGSTDDSIAIAEELGATVLNVSVRGYGAACYYAASKASGKYIIMGDCDDSYDFSDLSPFLSRLREGYDLVMGNRFKGEIKPGAMPWKNKHIGNPVISLIGRVLFNVPAGDFLCGLRGFTAQAFKDMDLQTTGMEFCTEMVIKATLLKLKIVEIATTLSRDGRSRPPHLQPWKDGWLNLRFMLLFSPRWLFWYPGWAAITFGLVLMLLLFPGPVTIGDIVFDIHTMLYASMAIIIGYQSITFGVITRKLGFHLGLLPVNDYIHTFEKFFKLEIILVAGFILIVFGLSGLIYTVFSWKETGFGELNPFETMRIVITTALMLIIGIQSILFAFAVSFIDLGIRRYKS